MRSLISASSDSASDSSYVNSGGKGGLGQIDDRVFVFVGGMQGSGATRVDRLLSSQPLASGFRPRSTYVASNKGCTYPEEGSPHRCHAPENEGVFLTKVFDNFLHKVLSNRCTMPLWGMCAHQERIFASDVKKAGGVHFRHQLLEDWGQWWNLSKPYLIEKDVATMVRSLFLQELMGAEHSAFIFTLRHPLANCRALKCDLARVIEAWLKVHEFWIQDLHLLQHHVAFHYDPFLLEPEEVSSAVKTMLGWPSLRYLDQSKIKAEKIEFAPVLEDSSKEFLRMRNKDQQQRRKTDRGGAQQPPASLPQNGARHPPSNSKPSRAVWDQVDERLRQEGLVSSSPRAATLPRGFRGRRLEATAVQRGGGVSSSSLGGWLRGKLTAESSSLGPLGLCMDEGIDEVVIQVPFDVREWVEKYPSALSSEQRTALAHFEKRLNVFCYSIDSLMPRSSLCSAARESRSQATNVIFSVSSNKHPLQPKKSYFESTCPRGNFTSRPYMQTGVVNLPPYRAMNPGRSSVTGKSKRFSIILDPASYNFTQSSKTNTDLTIASNVDRSALKIKSPAVYGRSPLTGTLNIRESRRGRMPEALLQGEHQRHSRRLEAVAVGESEVNHVSMIASESILAMLLAFSVVLSAVIYRRRYLRTGVSSSTKL